MYKYLKETEVDHEMLPFANISNAVRDAYDVRSIGNAVPKNFLRALITVLEDNNGQVYYTQKKESQYMINRVYDCKDRVLEVFSKIDALLDETKALLIKHDGSEYLVSRSMPKRIMFSDDDVKKIQLSEVL